MKYYNACLYGENDALTKHNVIEVENGIITEIKREANPVTTDGDYDCKGKVVYPTFMDSAVVIPGAEQFKLFGVDISSANDIEEYIQKITAGVTEHGVRAFGYNALVLGDDGDIRIKKLLDRLCPHTAAYVWADDMTSVIVNNYILEEAKRYFTVGRDLHKTGMLDLAEMQYILNNTDIFSFTHDEMELAVLAFQKNLLAKGITAVRTLSMYCSLETLDVLCDMMRKGVLLLDIIIYMPIYYFDTFEDIIARWAKYSVFSSGRIRVKGVSVTLDGSIDSGQAALKQPYEGDPDWTGSVLWNRVQLTNTLRKLAARGISVNVNAIGDAAVDIAIDALIASHCEGFVKPVRTLTHAYLMSDDAIQLCARNNITVCVEPNSVPYNHTFYDGDRVMLGDRIYSEYPIGRLAFAGINLIAGSNCPTQADVSPMHGVYKASHRVSADDVTPYRVLEMYGNNARELYGLSYDQGTIAVGMKANFVIVDKDIIHMREDLLCDVKNLATIVDGVVQWEE